MRKYLIIAIVATLGLIACSTDKKKEEVAMTPLSPAFQCSIVGEEGMLQIVATITLKPDADAAMLPIFEKLVAGSQMEEGCISYNLHRDVNVPFKYVILEVWKDRKAIDIHNETSHYKAYKEESKGYIQSADVSVITLVE